MFAARRFRLLGQLAGGGLRLGASPFCGTRLAARRAPGSAELAAERIAAELAELKARKTAADAAARKANAEADAAVETASETASKATWGKWRVRLTAGVTLLALGFVAWDTFSHWTPFVRWRMKQVICAGPSNLPAEVPAEQLLDVQQPNVVSGLPLLILGPSGSGKSTLMASLVRWKKRAGVPVVYFSTRSAYEHQREEPASAADSALAFQEAARGFCAAIGFPERPALWDRFSITNFSITWDSGFQVSAAPAVVNHFAKAISELFAVCVELKAETGVAPAIFLDEFHDFVSERLRTVGGKEVFILIADAMLKHCVDNGSVDVFAAASGAELADSFAAISKVKNFRARSFFTYEPSQASVQQRLRAVGFSEEDAEAIVATCGLRFRVLRPFLMARPSETGQGAMMTDAGLPLNVSVELGDIRAAAAQSVMALVVRAKAAGVEAEMAGLLDKLELGAAVGDSEVPAALKDPFPSGVLFRGKGGNVAFQSEPVKHAWAAWKAHRGH